MIERNPLIGNDAIEYAEAHGIGLTYRCDGESHPVTVEWARRVVEFQGATELERLSVRLTKTDRQALADKIANEHGCEILPHAFGGSAIVVQRYHSQGSPLDDRRISRCIDDLTSAGVLPVLRAWR